MYGLRERNADRGIDTPFSGEVGEKISLHEGAERGESSRRGAGGKGELDLGKRSNGRETSLTMVEVLRLSGDFTGWWKNSGTIDLFGMPRGPSSKPNMTAPPSSRSFLLGCSTFFARRSESGVGLRRECSSEKSPKAAQGFGAPPKASRPDLVHSVPTVLSNESAGVLKTMSVGTDWAV